MQGESHELVAAMFSPVCMSYHRSLAVLQAPTWPRQLSLVMTPTGAAWQQQLGTQGCRCVIEGGCVLGLPMACFMQHGDITCQQDDVTQAVVLLVHPLPAV
jgi:hypothetical protein